MRAYFSQPSSYPEYLGKRQTPWVHPEEILSYFSKSHLNISYQNEERVWFHGTEKEYQSFDPAIGLEYFDLSDKFSDQDLTKVLDFGTIHLSGGNTFEFLDSIRKRNFRQILKRAGLFNSDRNTVNLQDLRGLNFVDFEFSPHLYGHLPNPKTTPHFIYACDDHNGIFVNENNLEFLINVLKIQAGKII